MDVAGARCSCGQSFSRLQQGPSVDRRNPELGGVGGLRADCEAGSSKFFARSSDEVVSGGFVLVYVPGCADERRPEAQWTAEGAYSGPYSVVFEATWEELVVEGIIDEERRDSFNVPVYCHSLDEVRAAAESTHAYHIKRLEIKRQIYFAPTGVEQILAAPEQYGQFLRNFTRSLLNSYIAEHIGETSATQFFDDVERIAAAAARERRMSSLIIECVMAVLVRK